MQRGSVGEDIRPFRVEMPDAALADLQDRLARTRWPSELSGIGWSRGVPVDYLKGLAEYWRSGYDWRAAQMRLNSFPQYTTEIDGQTIHFIHVRSPEADALPLVVTHGWPGSIVEFLEVIGPLTDPRAYSGDRADAFHLVAPSLPGFAFSTPLHEAGWNTDRIASAWAVLMRRLGYKRYGAHGGDTGSIVSPELGRIDPAQVVGVHICGQLALPSGDPAELAALSTADWAKLARLQERAHDISGYSAIQSTRPKTLAYALTDSPVGQLAWIVEKFKEWTDPAADRPEDAVDRDHLLTNVSLYWLTETAGSSAQLYYETAHDSAQPKPRSPVPTGVAVFPGDSAIRSFLVRDHSIVHWSEFDRGGHFAAMEAPDLLIADLRAFFRRFR